MACVLFTVHLRRFFLQKLVLTLAESCDILMEEVSEIVHERGTARIKPHFIVKVPKSDVAQSQGLESKESEPPPKKKARGQNKNRPRTARDNKEDCLCPSLIHEEGLCMYGENCKFIHDVAKYMSTKPEDVGSNCFSYDTHGKCYYGLACRYGSCHICITQNGSYESVINAEKLASTPVPKMINLMPRDLRISLRKKNYSFPKSESIFGKTKSGSKVTSSVEVSLPVTDNSCVPSTKCVENIVDSESTGHLAETKIDEPQVNATAQTNVNTDNLNSLESAPTKEVSAGAVTNVDMIALKNGEKRTLKFDGKLFLAPLTTVGNLPFRVVCKSLGADITCGEMAMANCLLQGNVSEWALLKRHPCEDMFGVQICGSYPDTMTRCAELIENECTVDFIDINMGCPIDLVYRKGSGSALMQRTKRLFDIVKSMKKVMTVPLTCKMRTGIDAKKNNAHIIIPQLRDCGVALCTVHGRSRQARYTKLADWDYVENCAASAAPMPLYGNGDILSFEDYNEVVNNKTVAGVMIARGALIKPWIFTEIKEQRHWDISSSERFDLLKKFANQGLMHWGSDSRGVETTRRFLLEWLSFLHRYIPVGILEQPPQKINEKPPQYIGRDDLETLMADRNCNSWVKISEMLLGKVPEGFQFLPKHKANSYS